MHKVFSKKQLINKSGQLLLHIVFWIIVLLFFTYFFGFESNDFNYVLSYSLCLMPITIATTYVSTYKLIPDYLVTKQYLRFGLYSLYTFIISTYLIIVSIFFGLIFLSQFKYENMPPISRNIFFVMLAVFTIVIVVSAFKLLKLNLKQSKKAQLLETKILETQLLLKEQELNYLKMQIHPHFLFNTLNTMYGFALKKADETPDMILKLSNLLDYLLYQVDKPFVLLSEEINHIEDYIELEKIRFNDRLNIKFNVSNYNKNITIAPMLLLPFIENSFKHGTTESGFLNINIELITDENSITFKIENTSTKQTVLKNGIGLKNIKKRLEMLYKDLHELKISNEETKFRVELILSPKKND